MDKWQLQSKIDELKLENLRYREVVPVMLAEIERLEVIEQAFLLSARVLRTHLQVMLEIHKWPPSALPNMEREYNPGVAPCDDAEFGTKP